MSVSPLAVTADYASTRKHRVEGLVTPLRKMKQRGRSPFTEPLLRGKVTVPFPALYLGSGTPHRSPDDIGQRKSMQFYGQANRFGRLHSLNSYTNFILAEVDRNRKN